MKKLKKLSKKDLKLIEGGAIGCPLPAYSCADWCMWTDSQKARCPNFLLEISACVC
ncbi:MULTISPECIES: bacteriocin [Chryseobacterium]|uniref:Bacteriocin-type signal sequence-containing protein n=3 Tax=Chryseobacterium TaxID=59732 RepID=A0A6N4XA38_9FLAO|nr:MULTISPECIES: bacteriocin [Chryseobacterium]RNA61148.1 bacteriocin [Chryseobacterium nematophagum]CAA7196426.1 hypothetical protein CHRY9293_02517 [Chryseobacterium potabilaquae]CAA7388727.1 hypothetical protein CHRY9393_02003 [Chryseobacterium fistulae]